MVRHVASIPCLTDDTASTNTDFFLRSPSPVISTAPSFKGKHKDTFLSPFYVREADAHSPARGPISLPSPFYEQIWLEPNILKRLLRYLNCDDFCQATRVSSILRDIFKSQKLKDIVLSAYVPAYTVRANLISSERVRVSLSDLESLQTCTSNIPLWLYPQCAIEILSYTEKGQLPPPTLLGQQSDLEHFCKVHSRFVLLLRFQTHEWDFHFEDGDDHILRRSRSYPALKGLIFPPMLAYSGEEENSLPFTPELSSMNRDAKFDVLGKSDPLIQDRPSGSSSAPASLRRRSWLPDGPSSQTLDSHNTRGSKRFSLLFRSRRPAVPPPNPLKATPSLERSANHMYSKKPFEIPDESQMFNDGDGPGSPRNWDNPAFERLLSPKHVRHSTTTSSASSSTRSSRRSPPSKLSIHSVENAASRLRAPILRVFVPCSSLLESGVVEKATHQLVTAGLWNYLRNGDAICNLGYVARDSSLVHGWLIFIEGELHPFFPPELPQAVGLWKLFSPLYLTHLLPPHHNFRFTFSIPPGLEAKFHHEWMDVVMPSPGTKNGFVRVWRYEWFATVEFGSSEISRLGLGQGWIGTWILEMEGTREGGVKLAKALREGTSLTWEILMDKSSQRRLWLKCVDPDKEPVSRTPLLLRPCTPSKKTRPLMPLKQARPHSFHVSPSPGRSQSQPVPSSGLRDQSTQLAKPTQKISQNGTISKRHSLPAGPLLRTPSKDNGPQGPDLSKLSPSKSSNSLLKPSTARRLLRRPARPSR